MIACALLAISGLLTQGDHVVQALRRNWAAVVINQAWNKVTYRGARNDHLQDGIPDGWGVTWWGGSTQVYAIENQDALAGDRVTRINHTNAQGGAALTQRIAVEPNSHLVVTVYAKGAGGAIHVWFRTREEGDWVREGLGGWRYIEPTEDWQEFHLSVTVPSGMNDAMLLLYLDSRGSTSFDEAYAGVDNNGLLGPNLLRNPGFEQDGVSEDPLEWWQSHVVTGVLVVPEGGMPERLSYSNITDMLAGRYDAVARRAHHLGTRCVLAPEMTSWLTALGNQFEQEGGAAARERLYQLAIKLMPNCPQPYAALAGLYRSHYASWRAAELHHQAAELSGETALAGAYYFAEGFLHVTHTGDMERAIPTLQRAEQLSGWEGNRWYRGAASFYLGRALEAEGRLVEAAAAYQRVLDCAQCSYHHAGALERLNALFGGGEQGQ